MISTIPSLACKVGSDTSWGVLEDLGFSDEKIQRHVADPHLLLCLPLTQIGCRKGIATLLSPNDKHEHET